MNTDELPVGRAHPGLWGLLHLDKKSAPILERFLSGNNQIVRKTVLWATIRAFKDYDRESSVALALFSLMLAPRKDSSVYDKNVGLHLGPNPQFETSIPPG